MLAPPPRELAPPPTNILDPPLVRRTHVQIGINELHGGVQLLPQDHVRLGVHADYSKLAREHYRLVTSTATDLYQVPTGNRIVNNRFIVNRCEALIGQSYHTMLNICKESRFQPQSEFERNATVERGSKYKLFCKIENFFL